MLRITNFVGLLWVGLLTISSCHSTSEQGLPDKSEVPENKILKIDGLYRMSSEAAEDILSGFKSAGFDTDVEVTVRFDKGRAYFVNNRNESPGSVFIKNIKKIDDYTYSGLRLIISNDSCYECSTTIYLNGGNLISKTDATYENRVFKNIFYLKTKE